MKRIITVLLSVCMIVCMMPTVALAEGTAGDTAGTTETGTASATYEITTPEQFKAFYGILNAGEPAEDDATVTTELKSFYKAFGITGSYKATYGAFKSDSFLLKCNVDLTGETGFAGIKNFTGTFDGGNHKIKYSINIIDNTDEDLKVGLFKELKDSSTIKNVIIDEGSTIKVTKDSIKSLSAGAICGVQSPNVGKKYIIDNCISYADITVSRNGQNGGNYVGGIVGYSRGDITNCINYGNITYNCVQYCGVAGIAGFMDNTGSAAKMENCKNFGNIIVDRGTITADVKQGEIRIAGLTAHVYNVDVLGCENHGDIIRYGVTPTAHGVWAPSSNGNLTRKNLVNTGAMITDNGNCSFEGDAANNCLYTFALEGKPGETVTYSKDPNKSVVLDENGKGSMQLDISFLGVVNFDNSYYMSFKGSNEDILMGERTVGNPLGLKSVISALDQNNKVIKLQDKTFVIDSYEKLLLLQTALSANAENNTTAEKALKEFVKGSYIDSYPIWAQQMLLGSSSFELASDIKILNDGRFKGLGSTEVRFRGYIDMKGHTVTFDGINIDGGENSVIYGFVKHFDKNQFGGKYGISNGNFVGSITVTDAGSNTYIGSIVASMESNYLLIRQNGVVTSDVDITVTPSDTAANVIVGGCYGNYRCMANAWTVNKGDITVHSANDTQVAVGGVIGYQGGGTRENWMVNYGTVTVDSNVSGATVNNGTWYVGGISGHNGQGWSAGCQDYNFGTVNVNNTLSSTKSHNIAVGGIDGYTQQWRYGNNDLYSLGNINVTNTDTANAKVNVGGLYGDSQYFPSSLSNVVVTADIAAPSEASVGKISGIMQNIISPNKDSNNKNLPSYIPDNMNSVYVKGVEEAEGTFGAIGGKTEGQNLSPDGIGKITTDEEITVKYSKQYDLVKGTGIKGNLVKWVIDGEPCVKVDAGGKLTAIGVGTCSVKGVVEYVDDTGETKQIELCNVSVTTVKKIITDTSEIHSLNNTYPSQDSVNKGMDDIVISFEGQNNINGQTTLERGKDYELTNDSENNQIKVNFIGGYEGTVSIPYTIVVAVPEVSAEGYTGEYDGQAHTIKLTASEGAVVKYGISEDAVNDDSAPSYTDVGKHTIYYAVTKDGMADGQKVTGNVLIEIIPADLTIKADDKNIYVGDALPEYTYTVTGSAWGGTFVKDPEISCAGANNSKAGSFEIKVANADAGENYNIVYVPGKLTVRAHTVVPTVPTDPAKAAKNEAMDAVNGYVKPAEYEKAEQAEIKKIVDEAKKDIEAAKTAEEVKAIEAAAKAEIDKLETAEEKALIKEIEGIKLVARSKQVKMKNGKKAVKITWKTTDGKKVKFDGVEIYRSVKRYTGYGKKPFFSTKTNRYYNTLIKTGTKYYYRVRGFKYVNDEKVYTEYSLKAWRRVK